MFTPKDIGGMFSENISPGENPYVVGGLLDNWSDSGGSGSGKDWSSLLKFVPYIGAVYSMFAQHKVNKREMRFAERMSNTSWQRAIRDMKLAGINPIAAFSQGGASSPSVQLDSPGGGLSETAASVVQLINQSKLVNAQVDQMSASAGLSRAQAAAVGAEAGRAGELYDIKGLPEAKRWREMFDSTLRNMRQQADTGKSQELLNKIDLELKEMQKSGAEWTASNFQALMSLVEALPEWMQGPMRGLIWAAGQIFAPAVFGAMLRRGVPAGVKLPDGVTAFPGPSSNPYKYDKSGKPIHK